jgi:hypothetical protein
LLQLRHRAYDDGRKRAEQQSSYLMRTRRRVVKIRFLRAPNSAGSMDPAYSSIEIGENYELICPIRLGEC